MHPNINDLSQGWENWLQDVAVRKGSRAARVRRRGFRKTHQGAGECQGQIELLSNCHSLPSPPFIIWCSKMYKGAAPSPFLAEREGEILFFSGRENHCDNSNYIPVLGRIYLITGGVEKVGRGSRHLPGSDVGEVVFKEHY